MDKNNWEELNQKMMKNGWSEQAVFEIQDYLNEAFEKGKEEYIKEWKNVHFDFKQKFKDRIVRIGKNSDETFDLIDDLETFIMLNNINSRLQTLEEVEKVIKEKVILKTDDKVVDIAILLFSEDILQTLNKMK